MDNVTTIVQVSAIILGFMIAFFNKWLFWESNNKNNNKKKLSPLEYSVIFLGLSAEILFAITIVLGLSPVIILIKCIWLLMTFGVVNLVVAIILATICEINYINRK